MKKLFFIFFVLPFLSKAQSDSVKSQINIGIDTYVQTNYYFSFVRGDRSLFQYPTGNFIIVAYQKNFNKRMCAAVASGYGFFRKSSTEIQDTIRQYKSTMVPLKFGIGYVLVKSRKILLGLNVGTGIHYVRHIENNLNTNAKTNLSSFYWNYSYGVGVALIPAYKTPIKLEFNMTIMNDLKFKIIGLMIPITSFK